MTGPSSEAPETNASPDDKSRIDGLEAIPFRLKIAFDPSLPKTDGMPTLRNQIDEFLAIYKP